ncbi:MAG: hypothetical protein H6711_10615 [Myxococcales bacterium]|nr:hypothetical protein [Myxococcales bacterium]
MSKLADLRSAALPFVTRSLRGKRLRRTVLLSALLGILTLILGLWISFGSGRFEHEIRSGLGVEQSRWMRQDQEFVVFVDSIDEAIETRRDLKHLVATNGQGYWTRPKSLAEDAAYFLSQAALTPLPRSAYLPENEPIRELWQRAQALDATSPLRAALVLNEERRPWFDWNEPEHVARLQAIVDADLIPRIERYRSTLTTVDGVRLTGSIAGGIFALLALVLGPLLVGTQMAQEVHENTLMPLTGTSLRTRELLLGLAAGPLTLVAILAVPQVLLLLLTVAAVGHPIPALAGILTAIVGAFFLSMLAQLLGFSLGRQRSPGILGMGLLSFFGMLAMAGAGFGLAPSRYTIGVFAVLPEAATTHLLRSSLLPHELFFREWRLAHQADFAIAIGTVGIGVLGLLGLRALERRVGRVSGSTLSRREGLLGALVTTVLVLLALPRRGFSYRMDDGYLLSLAVLTIPFAILMMMRVPLAEAGERRGPLPVASLLGELGLWAGIHGVIVLGLLGRPDALFEVHPAAFLYLGWFLLVVGLLSIRVVARPLGLGARVWVGFAAFFSLIAFAQIAAFTRPWAHRNIGDLALFSHVSPFLGVAQVLLLVVIPWTLWRSLRARA